MISDIDKAAESILLVNKKHLIIVSVIMGVAGVYGARYYDKYIDNDSQIKSLNDKINSCNQERNSANENLSKCGSREEILVRKEKENNSIIAVKNNEINQCRTNIPNSQKCPPYEPPLPQEVNLFSPGRIGAELSTLTRLRLGRQRAILQGAYKFTAQEYNYGFMDLSEGCKLQIKKPRGEQQILSLEKGQFSIVTIEDLKISFNFTSRENINNDSICNFTISIVLN